MDFNAEDFLKANPKPWTYRYSKSGGETYTNNANNEEVPLDALLAYTQHLEQEYESMKSCALALADQKNNAYRERNKLVAALSKLFPAWIAQHPPGDKEWESDWRNIIFIMLPTGQASWHIQDSEIEQFAHLEDGPNCWDGHSTEEKYSRIASMTNHKLGEIGQLVQRLPELVGNWNRINLSTSVNGAFEVVRRKGPDYEYLSFGQEDSALEALKAAFGDMK